MTNDVSNNVAGGNANDNTDGVANGAADGVGDSTAGDVAGGDRDATTTEFFNEINKNNNFYMNSHWVPSHD